jgi:hypothetical protein
MIQIDPDPYWKVTDPNSGSYIHSFISRLSPSTAAVSEKECSPPPAVPLSSPPPLRGSYSSSSRLAAASGGVHKKVYLGGEEFDEIEPGVFNRSRHSLTRQSITQVRTVITIVHQPL